MTSLGRSVMMIASHWEEDVRRALDSPVRKVARRRYRLDMTHEGAEATQLASSDKGQPPDG